MGLNSIGIQVSADELFSSYTGKAVKHPVAKSDWADDDFFVWVSEKSDCIKSTYVPVTHIFFRLFTTPGPSPPSEGAIFKPVNPMEKPGHAASHLRLHTWPDLTPASSHVQSLASHLRLHTCRPGPHTCLHTRNARPHTLPHT